MKRLRFSILTLLTLIAGASLAFTFDAYSDKGNYFNLFGEDMGEGYYYFMYANEYGDTSMGSYLLHGSRFDDEFGGKIDFFIGIGDFAHTISAAFNTYDEFTPLAMKKYYDGYKWRTTSKWFDFTFINTREDDNLLPDVNNSIVTRTNRENFYGLSITGKFGKQRATFNYLNSHKSDGVVRTNQLNVLSYDVGEVGESTNVIYFKLANEGGVNSGANMKGLKITVDGTTVIDYDNMADVTKLADSGGGSTTTAYGSVTIYKGHNGYVVWELPFPVSDVANISSLIIEAEVSGNFAFGVSFDALEDYVMVYDVVEEAGGYDLGSDAFHWATAPLDAQELADVKETYDGEFFGRNLVMDQIVTFHGDLSYTFLDLGMRLDLKGEYGIRIIDEANYLAGAGNLTTNSFYEAFFVNAVGYFRDKTLRITLDYYYIDDNYATEKFHIDDDDANEVPDIYAKEMFVYPRPGEYEKDTVMPGLDRNENNVADWNEPFLDLFIYSPFLTMGEDRNNNYVYDTTEDDEALDLPYRAGSTGFELEAAYSFAPSPETIIVRLQTARKVTNSAFEASGMSALPALRLLTLDESTPGESVVEVAFKTHRFFGNAVLGNKFYEMTVNNSLKFIFQDTLSDPIIGRLDSIDNDGDGLVDEEDESVQEYSDTNGKTNVFFNQFFYGGKVRLFENLVFTHILKHTMKNTTNFGTGLAGLVQLEYNFVLPFFEDLAFRSLVQLEGFRYDDGVYVLNPAIEGSRFVGALLGRYEYATGSLSMALNFGVQYTKFEEKHSYLRYDRTSFKLELTAKNSKNVMLAWSYAYHIYDYTMPYDGLTDDFMTMYFIVKRAN